MSCIFTVFEKFKSTLCFEIILHTQLLPMHVPGKSLGQGYADTWFLDILVLTYESVIIEQQVCMVTETYRNMRQ